MCMRVVEGARLCGSARLDDKPYSVHVEESRKSNAELLRHQNGKYFTRWRFLYFLSARGRMRTRCTANFSRKGVLSRNACMYVLYMMVFYGRTSIQHVFGV